MCLPVSEEDGDDDDSPGSVGVPRSVARCHLQAPILSFAAAGYLALYIY